VKILIYSLLAVIIAGAIIYKLMEAANASRYGKKDPLDEDKSDKKTPWWKSTLGWLNIHRGSWFLLGGYIIGWVFFRGAQPEIWKSWSRLVSFWWVVTTFPAGVLIMKWGAGHFWKYVVVITMWSVVTMGFITELHSTPEWRAKRERELTERLARQVPRPWFMGDTTGFTWIDVKPDEWTVIKHPQGRTITQFKGRIAHPNARVAVQVTLPNGTKKPPVLYWSGKPPSFGEVKEIAYQSLELYPVKVGYRIDN